MIKVTGLETLARQLEELGKAAAELDGEITKVEFDATDPGSIQAAIQTMERAIDEKLSPYQHNKTVAGLAEQLKEKFRQKIVDRAAAIRAGEVKD